MRIDDYTSVEIKRKAKSYKDQDTDLATKKPVLKSALPFISHIPEAH